MTSEDIIEFIRSQRRKQGMTLTEVAKAGNLKNPTNIWSIEHSGEGTLTNIIKALKGLGFELEVKRI